MTRFTRKVKVLIIVSLAVIIAIGSTFVHLYKEKVYWEEAAASYNYSAWCEISSLTFVLDSSELTQQKIKEQYPHINGVIYTATANIYPAFNCTEGFGSVLRNRYDVLAQDIANGTGFTNETLDEAVALFESMNRDLYKLCKDILSKAEDKKGQIELRTVGSNLYNEAEKKVIDFCNEYERKCRELNERRF